MATNYVALDETKLRDALTALLGVLVDAAAGAAWVPSAAAVSVVRPGADCDSIFVWPDLVTPENAGVAPGKCERLPQVNLRWMVSSCVGAGIVEDAAWHDARVGLLDRIWAVIGGLYAASTDGTLCGALGLGCDNVRMGTAQRVDGGDQVTWEGTVTVVLGV